MEDRNGEVLLINLTENGEETQERLLIPVAFDADWDWNKTPKQLDDIAVVRLLMEMIQSLHHITGQYEVEREIVYTH
ncbi:MAG: hypothetical protein HN416_09700 [Nitrospina sp.]|nr:hypothetical protein [Nitrospina sp.]